MERTYIAACAVGRKVTWYMLSVVVASARWGTVLVDLLFFSGVGSRVASSSPVMDDGEVKIILRV